MGFLFKMSITTLSDVVLRREHLLAGAYNQAMFSLEKQDLYQSLKNSCHSL